MYSQGEKKEEKKMQLIVTSHKELEQSDRGRDEKSRAEMHKCGLLMSPHVDAHTDAHTHGRAGTQSRKELYLLLDSASH